MPKAPKKPVSDKKRIASQKNIDAWEAKQAQANRVSNDKEVFAKGYNKGYKQGMRRNALSVLAVGIVIGSALTAMLFQSV